MALWAIYSATGGDNWDNCFRGDNNPCTVAGVPGTPWLTAENQCDWGGVVCRNNNIREETELWLFGNGLTGSLPTEIAWLRALGKFCFCCSVSPCAHVRTCAIQRLTRSFGCCVAFIHCRDPLLIQQQINGTRAGKPW